MPPFFMHNILSTSGVTREPLGLVFTILMRSPYPFIKATLTGIFFDRELRFAHGLRNSFSQEYKVPISSISTVFFMFQFLFRTNLDMLRLTRNISFHIIL